MYSVLLPWLLFGVFVYLQAPCCVWPCGEWAAVCDRDGEPKGGRQPSPIRRRQNQQLWRVGANEMYVQQHLSCMHYTVIAG